MNIPLTGSQLSSSTPTQPLDLCGLPEAFQRAYGPTKQFENEFGELEFPERDPILYQGNRNINPRSRGSTRMFPVWLDREKLVPRVYGADSQIEGHNLALTLTSAKTFQVQEQFGPIPFTNEDGKSKNHYLDLLITQNDGRKIAVAVKPTARLESGRFFRELEALERSMSEDVADELRLVTERCFSRTDASNAVLYQNLAICRDDLVERRLNDILASTPGDTTICSLAERCRAGGRAFRVIVQGIFEGKLEMLSTGRIDLFTKVRRVQ